MKEKVKIILEPIVIFFPLFVVFLMTFVLPMILIRNYPEAQFMAGFLGGILFLATAQLIYPKIFLHRKE